MGGMENGKKQELKRNGYKKIKKIPKRSWKMYTKHIFFSKETNFPDIILAEIREI